MFLFFSLSFLVGSGSVKSVLRESSNVTSVHVQKPKEKSYTVRDVVISKTKEQNKARSKGQASVSIPFEATRSVVSCSA